MDFFDWATTRLHSTLGSSLGRSRSDRGFNETLASTTDTLRHFDFRSDGFDPTWKGPAFATPDVSPMLDAAAVAQTASVAAAAMTAAVPGARVAASTGRAHRASLKGANTCPTLGAAYFVMSLFLVRDSVPAGAFDKCFCYCGTYSRYMHITDAMCTPAKRRKLNAQFLRRLFLK
ncbi:hypothetical protein M885DRAFT_499211 [Pelagophyceae sp. CCMP2097]|nr:hypothetical protein M885DRAFT_499211 [Pelagophyceae sp. CCMP2097]